MKRILLLVFACVFALTMLTACNKPEEITEPQEAPTPVATEPAPTQTPEPEPETQPAQVLTSGVTVLYGLLERGTEVKVLGDSGKYYIVEHDGAEMYVEKWLVRMAGETAPEERNGYSKKNTHVYGSAYLEGEALATLGLNTEVTVKDEFGGVVFIEWDGQSGYSDADMISGKKIQSGGGNKGSGGGGGSADGGDIVLSARMNEKSNMILLAVSAEQPVYNAVVLSDGVEIYIGIPDMGDTVKVLEEGDDMCTVYYDGLTGTVSRNCLKFEGDEEYESWVGYTHSGTPLYEDSTMRSRTEKLDVNAEISILADMGDSYFVKVGEKTGYISKDKVSEEKIKSSGGKKGSGGGSGGGGAWTDPVL